MGLKVWYVYRPPISAFDACLEAIASGMRKRAAWQKYGDTTHVLLVEALVQEQSDVCRKELPAG
jgi:hypothetical protein